MPCLIKSVKRITACCVDDLVLKPALVTFAHFSAAVNTDYLRQRFIKFDSGPEICAAPSIIKEAGISSYPRDIFRFSFLKIS